MDFIKTLAKNKPGRVPSDGCVILSNGQLNVKIKTRTHDVSQVGIIDGGIGCILTERKKERQTEIANATRPVSDGDIPANLMSERYRFRIPGKKLSDTEYVFMFDKAHMLNK